jgi:arylformamidase
MPRRTSYPAALLAKYSLRISVRQAAMIDDRLEKQYALGHLRPDLNFLPDWNRRSMAFRQAGKCQLDLSYGPGPRDRLDYFPSAEPKSSPTVVFFHGGYWQRGDKSAYSFLAESFVKNGVSFAAINYDFCPGVRITQIVDQARKAMAWLWHNIDGLGGDQQKFSIVGHSAGAHISGMMMTTDWPSFAEGLPRDMLKGALLVSGIFDLEPLLATTNNDSLHLDRKEAFSQSPINHAAVTSAPQMIACGDDETQEFKRQSDQYVATFGLSNGSITRHIVPGNHFDVLNELSDEHSGFHRSVRHFIASLSGEPAEPNTLAAGAR